ncbi:MAG: choice-of-anchor D domain-containing protein [Verrucomicrobiota bacterium]
MPCGVAWLAGAGFSGAGMVDFPGPPGTSNFGGDVKVLPNGNFVVVDEYYTPPGMNVRTGGVFVYSSSGALISTLTGSKSDDRVGSGGITLLANGNFVIESYRWDNGTAIDAGAVTWGSMTTGVSGVVSPENSLVGSRYNDQIGDSAQTRGTGGIVALSNGNYVVCSPTWDNGLLVDAGAVTWGSGTSGVKGVISGENSLVGSFGNFALGQNLNGGGVTPAGTGNYVVSCPGWRTTAAAGLGAVTWCDGAVGRTGFITADNSLVGTQAGDMVGGGRTRGRSVVVLSGGDYVVSSPNWSRGLVKNTGAVTWCPGNAGRSGPVTETNSLVGVKAGDKISGFETGFPGVEGVIALKNGNYAVSSFRWDRDALVDAGAVTWCQGDGSTTGPVTAANSVTGSTAGDMIGRTAALSSGDYVVAGDLWDNGSAADAGAARLMSGTAPSSGLLTPVNSLVGTQAGDHVSSAGITALTNGNFVVASPLWKKGALSSAGAVTWVNGSTGLTGAVTAENSLTGSQAGDLVGGYAASTSFLFGGRVSALTNGHYVVSSPSWKNGTFRVGAVTWANGVTGQTGTVTAENSIIGADNVGFVGGGPSDNYPGGVTALANGHYVIGSPVRQDGALRYAGAFTWASGSGPSSFVISGANSLVGSVKDEYLGAVKPSTLADGGFLLLSPAWTNLDNHETGALFFADGTAPLSGPLNAGNSVVATEAVGGTRFFPFSQDVPGKRILVGVPYSNRVTILTQGTPPVPKLTLEQGNGSPLAAGGSVALGEIAPGATKVIQLIFRNPGYADLNLTSASSTDPQFSVLLPAGGTTLKRGETLSIPLSFTPQQTGARITVIHLLSNDPDSPDFTFTVNASASGTTGTFATDIMGPSGSGRFGREVFYLPNGNLVITDPWYDAPGPVADVGAVYLFSPGGAMLSKLTGSTAGDFVGDGGVAVLANGNYVIRSASWANQGVLLAGAATWASGVSGISGTVSAANSLVGSHAGDDIGAGYTFNGRPGIIPLPNGNYIVLSPVWNKASNESSMTGAVTWGNGATGTSGVISSANSITGYRVGESGLEVLSNGNCVVTSSVAATWLPAATGAAGQISASNSLIVSGYEGVNVVVRGLTDGNYATAWTGFNGGAGAVAWSNGSTGGRGTLQAKDCVVGNVTDAVGSGGIITLPEGRYAVLSPLWSNESGAVTWCAAGGATKGVVSPANSLTGSQLRDSVGRDGVVVLANGNCIVPSHDWANGTATSAGAVTWSGALNPTIGPVSPANSLVGSLTNDHVGALVTALDGGNYVVGSEGWNRYQGAVTWCSGTTGRRGPVTEGNSLVGLPPANIGALRSGAYVVTCPLWANKAGAVVGAVTWMSGPTDGAGSFNPANAIMGSADQDYVGGGGIEPLANGHFVILSPKWSANRGAVTWADGFKSLHGVISAANSLVGTSPGDYAGGNTNGVNNNPGYRVITALANGNYVCAHPFWSNGLQINAGAVTFGNGQGGVSGEVSAANSIIGKNIYDGVGVGGIDSWGDSAWALRCGSYKPSLSPLRYGAMVLGEGRASAAGRGALDSRNSVTSQGINTGSAMSRDHHPASGQWAVGRPNDNVVTLFTYASPAQRQLSLETPGGIDLPDGSVVDFGLMDPGQPVDRTVTIMNSGGDPLHLGAMTFSDPQFKVQSPPALSMLPPGGRTDFVLRFTPVSPGLKSGTLLLASDDPEKPVVTLNLRGTARASADAPFGDEIRPAEITALPEGKTSIRFQAVPGITYLLQRSQDLSAWSFSCLVTADATGTLVFTDENPPHPAAFYRLKAR